MKARLQAQRGSGLMELMIAITIGLLLISAVVAMFASTKQNQISQSGLAQLQDNQRTAMSIIGQIIQSTGYYPTVANSTTTNITALPADSTNGFAAGQAISGVSGISGSSDILRVRFQTAPGDGILNCTGGSNPASATTNQTYVNVFTVNPTSHTLTCDSGNGAQPLVDGISSMSVLYGVDENNSGSVSHYYSAATLPAGASIRSVKVTLVLFNPMAGQPGQPASVSFSSTIGLMSLL